MSEKTIIVFRDEVVSGLLDEWRELVKKYVPHINDNGFARIKTLKQSIQTIMRLDGKDVAHAAASMADSWTGHDKSAMAMNAKTALVVMAAIELFDEHGRKAYWF